MLLTPPLPLPYKGGELLPHKKSPTREGSGYRLARRRGSVRHSPPFKGKGYGKGNG